MRRRDLLKGVAGIAAMSVDGRASEMTVQNRLSVPGAIGTEIVRLKLKHTWTTTMSSSEFRDNLHLRFTRDGISAFGEGAPIVRYSENVESARLAVESVKAFLASANPWHFEKVIAEVFRRINGQYAAKAAIDPTADAGQHAGLRDDRWRFYGSGNVQGRNEPSQTRQR